MDKSEETDRGNRGDADSFIVPKTKRFVEAVGAVTPFGLTERWLLPNAIASYFFVDAWVLSHFLAAIVVWLVMSPLTWPAWLSLLLIYGAWRIVEVCMYHMRILLGGHKKLPRPDMLRSARRSLLLALFNYAEVLFWFAAMYRSIATSFQTEQMVGTITGSFYFSLLTMATYGDIAPTTPGARWLVAIHLMVALYLTLVVLARIISLLPRVTSLDDD